MYAEVNQLFGDIVKVTPTSKVVGDMALFMVANNLTPDDVLDPKRELAFPESVVEFFEGKLGQPPGGFPPALQKRSPARPQAARPTGPGATLPPADFAAARKRARSQARRARRPTRTWSRTCSTRRCSPTSPRTRRSTPTLSVLPTPVFFYGMEPGEEVSVDIEPGKTLIVKFLTVGDPHPDGTRHGVLRAERPAARGAGDRTSRSAADGRRRGRRRSRATRCTSPRRCRARWCAVAVAAGEEVAAGQKLLTLEAMKMETTLYAERAGKVAEVLARAGTQVEAGDLLIRFEK